MSSPVRAGSLSLRSLFFLRDDREDKKEKVFHYEGGIKEFVTYLNRSNVPLYDNVIYCEGKKDNVLVEVAMQHNDSYTENIYSFVRNAVSRRRIFKVS